MKCPDCHATIDHTELFLSSFEDAFNDSEATVVIKLVDGKPTVTGFGNDDDIDAIYDKAVLLKRAQAFLDKGAFDCASFWCPSCEGVIQDDLPWDDTTLVEYLDDVAHTLGEFAIDGPRIVFKRRKGCAGCGVSGSWTWEVEDDGKDGKDK